MSKKVYAVKEGRKPGLYETWAECEEQVKNFAGAKYKGFLNRDDAEKYLGIKPEKDEIDDIIDSVSEKQLEIYTDGSFDSKTNKYGWAFAVVEDEEIIYSKNGHGEFGSDNNIGNVAGELSAIMHALMYLRNNDLKAIICHDYTGVDCWLDGSWKAKNELVKSYVNFMLNNNYKHNIINFLRVKGHSNNYFNDFVDREAKKACGIS